MAPHPDQPTGTTHHVVLRVRLGIDHPTNLDRATLEDRIATAITDVVTDSRATLDVLQIGLAARPDWEQFGPLNRVTGGPLWDPAPTHDPRTV